MTGMPPEWASLILELAGIAGGLFSVGCGFTAWLARQTLVTRDDLGKVRDEVSDVRARLALHRQEDATTHARLDGEMANLRVQVAALPTQRDVAGVTSAIERMRVEVVGQLGAVAGDVKAMDARLGMVHEALGRTQDIVDRHEQIISDAAARQQRERERTHG